MSTPAVTTQEQHAGRATWRTVVQGILSTVLVLGIVAPVVAAIIGEELGYLLGEHTVATITAVCAAIAAVGGALARIMAIPAVDGWLERLRLGSAPDVDVAQVLTARGRRTARVQPVDPPEPPQG